ncbi:hypothetical protein Pla22_00620 [Rubripirellula amarantea]|uniref:Protein-glutamine gamma-glutamyltransferase-like C-terminal domain-containing protein n=1 Tax=Rubripirellula amarantea TaxID=2527999 RepID=A0A5C5WP68_9BACT|nr:DUF4129 domain-containing protein [Rubripirellula amarantea]TWT52438.1 hypothetical protein Pla22_00620 [Rubripirellula amarantea]
MIRLCLSLLLVCSFAGAFCRMVVSADDVVASDIATSDIATSDVVASDVVASDVVADDVVGHSVWYDADEKAIIPVTVKSKFDDSLNRESRWLPQAKRVKKPAPIPASAGNTGGGGAGNGLFGSGLTFSNLLGWGLLVLLLGGAIAAVLFALSRAEIEMASGPGGRRRSHDHESLDEQTIERMKHLPAELRRTDVNPRVEAERLMREGLFDQAIILLFGHQLLLLDRASFLRLNRGKTNRRYARECKSVNESASDALQMTIDAFERSYFGRHEITAAEFQQLWSTNLQLEHVVETAHEVAA